MKLSENIWFWLAIGFVSPLVFGLLFFCIFSSVDLPLFEALASYAHHAPSIIGKMILVSLVPNLFGVFVCYHAQWWRAGRGLFIPILFYLATAMFFV